MRSIVQRVVELVGAELRVGREQTTQRQPGSYLADYHLIRLRTGGSVAGLHEAGHALLALLEEQKPGYAGEMRTQLLNVANLPDTFASGTWTADGFVTTPEEGFAEWVRRYIWNPTNSPGTYQACSRGLRDAHRAGLAWPSTH